MSSTQEIQWLPEYVRAALDEIYRGASGGALESETLEFKEDPATATRAGGAPQRGNSRGELIKRVIEEAIAFANSDAATGYIIIGVSDKKSGPEAFTGTAFDPETLRKRIASKTLPNLTVEAVALSYEGVRLLVIHVPEALTLYTDSHGSATRREGTGRTTLTQQQRQAIMAARANPDFSNGPSDIDISDCDPQALSEGRRLVDTVRRGRGLDGVTSRTTRGFFGELGLLDKAGKPKRAAHLLFGRPQVGDVTIRHLWRPIQGADPIATEISKPIVLALPLARDLVEKYAVQAAPSSQRIVQFDNGQEVQTPPFPRVAVDECLVNALVHRDWRLSRPIVIDQTPRILKIWSPGPLPESVTTDRLLTTQSVPRNSRLMAAMRALGLAEESSRGFDRIWAAMLRTGRPTPEINATSDYVEIILSAASSDVSFMIALNRLKQHFTPEIVDSVSVLILLKELWNSSLVTESAAAKQTQSSRLETRELLHDLQSLGILTRLAPAKEWTLSATARNIMLATDSATVLQLPLEAWLQSQLDSGRELRAAEVSAELNVSRGDVTAALRKLRDAGHARIDPDGPQRGPGTRWIKA